MARNLKTCSSESRIGSQLDPIKRICGSLSSHLPMADVSPSDCSSVLSTRAPLSLLRLGRSTIVASPVPEPTKDPCSCPHLHGRDQAVLDQAGPVAGPRGGDTSLSSRQSTRISLLRSYGYSLHQHYAFLTIITWLAVLEAVRPLDSTCSGLASQRERSSPVHSRPHTPSHSLGPCFLPGRLALHPSLAQALFRLVRGWSMGVA